MDEDCIDATGGAPVKTAIVGSTGMAYRFGDGAINLVGLILSSQGTILTRATRETGVDALVIEICRIAGRECKTYPIEGPSRGGAFVRDLKLIADADKIIAIFAPDRVMEGGTGHIVNKALDERKEVEAYTIDDTGELVLVGGNNPRTDDAT
jgi:hypothetical protein